MKIINIFFVVFLSAALILIYKSWFIDGEIIGGDWPYFYQEMLEEFSVTFPLWRSQGGVGLGGIDPNFAFLSYQHFIVDAFVNTIDLPWQIVYKIFWFGLFIVLSIFSVTSLFKTLFGNINLWQISVGIFIFLANTYILMIVGGGQMGIALAYSIAPLVLTRFIKLVGSLPIQSSQFKIQNSKFKIKDQNVKIFKEAILTALISSIQIMFDIRIAYITIAIVLLYIIYNYLFIKRFNLLHTSYFILLTSIVVLGIHVYWIFPFVAFNLFSVPSGLTSVEGFQFFSFADFSHAISLLHPNWPENIFGKTYFLQPEFLMLPILAYSSLLFISKIPAKQDLAPRDKNQKFYSSSEAQAESRSPLQDSSRQAPNRNGSGQARTVIYFSLVGLLGAFLAKGVNPPFGFINEWLFQYFPGMNMFRDPTKFYLLIVLSYSVLIPFSVHSIYNWIKSKVKSQKSKLQLKIQNFFPNLFLLFTILYLIFLIRPAWMGQLGGTFKSYEVPKEYIDLKDFIVSQPEFFRALWIPTQSRFRIQTENHPLINADVLFKTSSQSAITQRLVQPETRELFQKLSVKYIIIPYDSTAEIFLEDRKYDHSKRLKIEKEMDKIPWLKKVQGGRIAIYEIQGYYDHFWLEGDGAISYQRIDSSKYNLLLNTKNPSHVVFSESFHPFWKASINGIVIKGKKTQEGLIRFDVPDGNYRMIVLFEPQKWAKYGYAFSVTILAIAIIAVYKLRHYGKNQK